VQIQVVSTLLAVVLVVYMRLILMQIELDQDPHLEVVDLVGNATEIVRVVMVFLPLVVVVEAQVQLTHQQLSMVVMVVLVSSLSLIPLNK
jgi:hypothetical protein